jgi:predicted nucleic-acid-binding protein
VIGIDTNVLVRHLVEDDPEQAELVRRVIDARTPDDPAFVSTAVVIETIRVLKRRYRVGRSDIHRAFEALLCTRELVFESGPALWRAIQDADEAGNDLADAIIAHAAIDAGCDGIVTFDKQAQRLPGMLPVG